MLQEAKQKGSEVDAQVAAIYVVIDLINTAPEDQ